MSLWSKEGESGSDAAYDDDDVVGVKKPWGPEPGSGVHPLEMGKRDFLKISRILKDMPAARSRR